MSSKNVVIGNIMDVYDNPIAERPGLFRVPVEYKICSATVVFPASTYANSPIVFCIFLYFF